MDVMTAIKARRSIRAYKDMPIEDEKLEAVLEAGRLAPSARNLQEWKYVVVKDKALRDKLVDVANGQRFVGQAPVVIVACAVQTDHVMPCEELSYPIDMAISIDPFNRSVFDLHYFGVRYHSDASLLEQVQEHSPVRTMNIQIQVWEKLYKGSVLSLLGQP